MDKSLFESIPGLENYFDSLPPDVQGKLLMSGKEITSLGEVMLIAEHLRGESRMEAERAGGEG